MPVAPTLERPLPAAPAVSGADTRSLPRQRALLSWLFAARTLLAVGTLLAAALVWTRTPDVSFIFSIAVLVTLVATAYGWWRVRIRGGEIGSLFLVGQALADLGLVTTLVHYASAPAIFASLYVLVIAGYAVLLPPQLGVLVTVCATILYVSDTLLGGSSGPDAAFWVQVVLFNVVFAIVAVLGHRLRASDAAAAHAGIRAPARPARGRRDPAEHPVGRDHGGRRGAARVHQPDGGAAARHQRRPIARPARSSTSFIRSRRTWVPPSSRASGMAGR